MDADRTSPQVQDQDQDQDSDPELEELHAGHVPKRHARVTVKYNRRELQRRLEVEKWIDQRLDELYSGQESDMPEEVNIDELIDLTSDEERVHKLKEVLQKCSSDTESFILELVEKLEGMHKQEELQTVEHPVISQGHYRHEPYHFNHPHHRGPPHTPRPNKTL